VEPTPGRQTVDLRGVPCPRTWARAKAVLEELPSGTVVEVVTDDARSARDIPQAAELEGYVVLSKTESADAVVRIVIER
jgi:TusA-related sulfurtransferase